MYSMPFKVMRESRASLIDQVADGIRTSISAGHYKAGDTLPNLHRMAAALGVSEIVTRRAVQRLAREGILNPRRGTGISVCSSDTKTWRGHVLYVHCSNPEMYYHGVMSSVIVDSLHASDFLVSTVCFSLRDFSSSLEKVRAELAHAVNLAVLEGSVDQVAKMFADRRIPFIQCGSPDFRLSLRASGTVIRTNMPALSAMRDHCMECGIRSVMQVVTGSDAAYSTEKLLKEAGMKVATLCAEPAEGAGTTEGIERGALESMAAWLQRSKKLPDLIWFPDDFTARGALLAMSARGVRIPEDVQVISWANKGLGPVYMKPLTRVEIDPRAHGEAFARYILDYLDGKAAPQIELVPEFIVGETTRPRR